MNSYCYHFINNLKGAASSEMMNNQQQGQGQMQQGQQQTLSFDSTQVLLIEKTLELCRLFVDKNPQIFQQSQQQEILFKIDKSLQIISGKNNNNKSNNNNINTNLKGASSINNKIQSFQNIRKMMFGYNAVVNTNNNNALKGASSVVSSNHNVCPTKQKNLKNLLNCFS
jgi:hypothetical protein